MTERETPAAETLGAAGEGQAPVQPAPAAEPDPLTRPDEAAQSAEAELFPATAAARSPNPEDAGDGEPDEPDEPETFASAEAPWVGAEKKWLQGIDEAPTAPAAPPSSDDPAKEKSESPFGEEDDALLVTAHIPVLPSLIPPARTGVGLGLKLGIAGALILVIGVAAAIVYWMNESFSEREREILALRDSDKQEAVRLEREIRELLARGGAKNEERANALKIALLAAKQEAAVATSGDATNPREDNQEHRETRDSEGAAGAIPEPTAAAPATPYDQPATATAEADKAGGTQAPEDPEAADLLDSAFSKAPAIATESPPPIQGAAEFPLGGTELPASPSRDQVKAAMDSIAPQVKACGPGGGRIVLSLAVSGATGRVVSAEPTGDHAGTPLGLCAARAVKPARFPHFKQERLQIKYPFDL